MPLQPGHNLLHYRIVEKIGEGGMGEVYRATDTTLDRDVAIKVLPENLAHDTERLARFEREAKLLASLNHANIATLHGLGNQDGTRFLIMEMVLGRTLAEVLTVGPVPVEDALRIGCQIAEAVEAAHGRGVIHRDLKPANIKIGSGGHVKVLDFGLAKAWLEEESDADLSHSPTVTAGTHAGVILGTAGYMSPEQTRGKPVGRDADIWAFGCVLYEMLTGQQPFRGESIADTIARTLEREPDLEALPARTPPAVRKMIRRCLQKSPAARQRDIGDARIELSEALTDPPDTPGPGGASPQSWLIGAIPWAIVLVAAVVTTVVLLDRRSPVRAPGGPRHVAIPLTDVRFGRLETERPKVAISPDGGSILVTANGRVFLRRLDSEAFAAVPGTEDARAGFFSPDGEWVGFTTAYKLKKVSIHGGVPVDLCDARFSFGAMWNTDGTILFHRIADGGMLRVSDNGDEPELITRAEPNRRHIVSDVLPGGAGILFTDWPSDREEKDARVVVLLPETNEQRVLLQGASSARYVETGHIVFAKGGTILTQKFDLSTLKTTGSSMPVVENLWRTGIDAPFGISSSGSLVYLPGKIREGSRTLVRTDPTGREEPVTDRVLEYTGVRVSPEGNRLAVSAEGALWVYDFGRDTLGRLTFGDATAWMPVWAPDEKRVAFVTTTTKSDGRAGTAIMVKDASGGSTPEQLSESSNTHIPYSWSPDGMTLAFAEQTQATGWDIALLSMESNKRKLFLQSDSNELWPVFSPDGRWLLYESNISGAYEVYVRPVSGAGGPWQISVDGGGCAIWSRDGSEIFYVDEKVVGVPVQTDPFVAGAPRELFSATDYYCYLCSCWDVTPDGDFIMIKELDRLAPPTHLNLVLDWFEELERLTTPTQ